MNPNSFSSTEFKALKKDLKTLIRDMPSLKSLRQKEVLVLQQSESCRITVGREPGTNIF
jgi:uncharacterized protein YwlG (UPF0340 family)